VPAGARLRVVGSSALRVTSLDRGGAVLADVEVPPKSRKTAVKLPAGTTRVALMALGAPVKPSSPSRTRTRSPSPQPVLAGWTTSQPAISIGAGIALVGNAHLILSRDARTATDEALVPVSRLLAAATGVETVLPASTSVVAVILDEADCGAADAGDLAISVRGAKAGPPLRLAVDGRRAALYEVTAEKGSAGIAVTVASARGFRVAGILGLGGKADDAVAWLQSQELQVAPGDAFAAPTGAVTVLIDRGK
jgi:hypothetical protein